MGQRGIFHVNRGAEANAPMAPFDQWIKAFTQDHYQFVDIGEVRKKPMDKNWDVEIKVKDASGKAESWYLAMNGERVQAGKGEPGVAAEPEGTVFPFSMTSLKSATPLAGSCAFFIFRRSWCGRPFRRRMLGWHCAIQPGLGSNHFFQQIERFDVMGGDVEALAGLGGVQFLDHVGTSEPVAAARRGRIGYIRPYVLQLRTIKRGGSPPQASALKLGLIALRHVFRAIWREEVRPVVGS